MSKRSFSETGFSGLRVVSCYERLTTLFCTVQTSHAVRHGSAF
nr:MAG TPA: hypothetical protein [Caudoviricetes sp.]